MQAQFDEAVDKSTQALISDKNKEIDLAKKELQQAKMTIREELESGLRAAIEKEVSERYKKEIKEAKEEKENAKKIGSAYRELAKDHSKLEKEHEQLERILEQSNASMVDQSRERIIRKEGGDLLVSVKGIKEDLEKNGGDMNLSITAIQELMKALSVELTDICGTEFIDI